MRQKNQELANAIAEWQEHCSMLDMQNKELSKQLLKASNKAKKSETGTEWSEDDADSEWNKDDPEFEESVDEGTSIFVNLSFPLRNGFTSFLCVSPNSQSELQNWN